MVVFLIHCVYLMIYLKVVSYVLCSSFCIQMIAGVVVRTDVFKKFSDDNAIANLLFGDQDDWTCYIWVPG